MGTIDDRVSEIRSLVNAPRRQLALYENRELWFQLCSSLDVLGDTELALASFVEQPSGDLGSVYLQIYGVLQALVLQQDALTQLRDALSLPPLPWDTEVLGDVRKIRNMTAGHATKITRPQGTLSFHQIARISLEPSRYELHSAERQGDGTFRPSRRSIDVAEQIERQRERLAAQLEKTVRALEGQDRMHANQFVKEPLVPLFRGSEYVCEKLSTADRDVGEAALASLRKMVEAFEQALERRGIRRSAYAGIESLLAEIEYPMGEVDLYFSNGPDAVATKAARIFGWFIAQRVAELVEMAAEIDADYVEAAGTTIIFGTRG